MCNKMTKTPSANSWGWCFPHVRIKKRDRWLATSDTTSQSKCFCVQSTWVLSFLAVFSSSLFCFVLFCSPLLHEHSQHCCWIDTCWSVSLQTRARPLKRWRKEMVFSTAHNHFRSCMSPGLYTNHSTWGFSEKSTLTFLPPTVAEFGGLKLTNLDTAQRRGGDRASVWPTGIMCDQEHDDMELGRFN